MNQDDSGPTVPNKVSNELPSIATTDPDTSSHPETITVDSKPNLDRPAAVVTTMKTATTIESPLIVFDIRYDSDKDENNRPVEIRHGSNIQDDHFTDKSPAHETNEIK